MVMSGIIRDILFIPSLFILSMFLAFFFRKRIVKKILFLEFDENLKNLSPRDFFYSILKMEKSIKSFYLAEVLFLLADILFILFGGYAMYLEKLEFSKKYSDFPVSPMPFVVERLTAPIILWVSMLFLLLLTLFMIKKEKKRVSDMLNYLNKSFNPVRIFFSKKETAEQVRNFILKK